VITQVVLGKALPGELQRQRSTATRLGDAYKQLNAPFGAFGVDTLSASTKAIAGDDATYESIETKLSDLTAAREALAAQIRTALDGAAFGGQTLPEKQAREWIKQARSLLDQAHTLGT
jgi:hypothetical protein